MSAAPVPCGSCGRIIGQRRHHHVLADGSVWCMACVRRHDAYDQIVSFATRAGIARHRPQPCR